MARGRMISSTVSTDKRLNSLSIEAHLVFMMTIPHLDRDGLLLADAPILAGKVCPRRDELRHKMESIIAEWIALNLVISYECEDGTVLFFTGFANNQVGMRYEREPRSELPPPPGYIRTEAGLELLHTAPLPPVDDNAPPIDGNHPATIRQPSGNLPPEEKRREEEREVEVEEKRTRVRVESPREPAQKQIAFSSPHLDLRRFVNGYIPPGTGRNPLEVYYERFSINQDAARLNSVKEDDLIGLCQDLERLREVVTAYSRTNFQVGNLQLILDWYQDGVPDKHRRPDASSPKASSRLSPVEKTLAAGEELRALFVAQGKEHLLHG